jgi:hypothetical protein
LARFPSRSFPPRLAGASPEEPEAGATEPPQSQRSDGEEGDAAGFGTIHSMADSAWSIRDLGIEERGRSDEQCGLWRRRDGGRKFGIEKGSLFYIWSSFLSFLPFSFFHM